MGSLLEAGLVVTWLGKLPEIQQYVIAISGFAAAVAAPIWGAVRAFRKGRREAMAEQMEAFEREQAERESAQHAPSRNTDITGTHERIISLEVRLAKEGWNLEQCRAEYGREQSARRAAEAAEAQSAQALIDVRYRLEVSEKANAALQRELADARAKLAALERAKTDPPPPLPTRRAD